MTRRTTGLNDITITISTRITVSQKIMLENLSIKTGKDMAAHVREALDMVFDKYDIEASQLVET